MSAFNGFYEDAGVLCPRCMGDGRAECLCGGDFCVCENYGERDCPVCDGEGEVTEAREVKYLEAQAEMARAWREAVDKSAV